MVDQLNLTEEEVFAALESEFNMEFMQPGDLSTLMVSERFKVNFGNARRHMLGLVQAGKFTEHKVRRVEDGRIVTVYRKVTV